jgi:hypothetical protein
MARLSKYGGTSGATLTIATTETLTINGKDYGGAVSRTINNVKNVDRRLETIPASEIVLGTFGTAVAGGTYDVDKVKYMRFTNVDDTNFISLIFETEGDHEFVIKLDAGCSLSIFGDIGDTGSTGGFMSMFDANTTDVGTGTLDNLKSIHAISDTAACDMELYVAII